MRIAKARLSKRFGCALGIAVSLWCGASGGEELLYRVAGILAVDDKAPLAVIELTAEEQGVFAEGDRLGDGSILDVTLEGVSVEVAGEVHFLPLRGDRAALSSADDPAARLITGSTEVNFQKVIEQLSALASSAQGKANKAAVGPAMNRIFKLPPQARIIAIDQTAVSSERAAIDTLKSTLRQGNVPRLVISGVPDLQEVYVVPSQIPAAE